MPSVPVLQSDAIATRGKEGQGVSFFCARALLDHTKPIANRGSRFASPPQLLFNSSLHDAFRIVPYYYLTHPY